MPLRIVCCYRDESHIDPRAKEALVTAISGLDVDVILHPVGDSPFAYGEWLDYHWSMCSRGSQSLAIVEPDIVVRPDVIDAFLNRPDPYVCFPYALLTEVAPALGCTRFSNEFIREHPTLIDEAVAMNVSWRQLDVVIQRKLLVGKYGIQPLVLLPPVEHLNPAKALLPDADPTPVMGIPDMFGNLEVLA